MFIGACYKWVFITINKAFLQENKLLNVQKINEEGMLQEVTGLPL